MNYFGTLEPIFADEYNICGVKVSVYHYFKEKGDKTKYTPFKQHIAQTSMYEGIYHPVCKVGYYPNLTIDENGIKSNGTKGEYRYSDKGTKIKLNKRKLIGLIVCGLHSLKYRLFIDINRINDNKRIDKGHLKAHEYTINFINYHLNRLTDFTCIPELQNIIKPNEVKNIYSLISNGTPKEQIVEEYNKIKNVGTIVLKKDLIKKKLF